MRYEDIPKRARNSIEYNIRKLARKYGFLETRHVVTRYFNQERETAKLNDQISDAEERLRELKNERASK